MKNKNGVTHTGTMRGQYAYNKLQVLFLTGMTEEQLHDFQFNTGVEWLQHHTGDTPEVIRWLLREELVWNWWINQWNLRDVENLGMIYDKYDDSGSIAEWLSGAMCSVDARGLIVTPDGLELDSAAAEIRHSDVLAEYRSLHQEVFIKYHLPYNLLQKEYEAALRKAQKERTTQS